MRTTATLLWLAGVMALAVFVHPGLLVILVPLVVAQI